MLLININICKREVSQQGLRFRLPPGWDFQCTEGFLEGCWCVGEIGANGGFLFDWHSDCELQE